MIGNTIDIDGTDYEIVDKYRGVSYYKHEISSGQGGTFRVESPIPVDYYLLCREDGQTKSIRCDRVNSINW